MNKYQADLIFIGLSILNGSSYVAAQYCFHYATPSVYITLRFMIASIVITILVRKSIPKINRLTLFSGSICGLCFGLGLYLLTLALKGSDTGRVALIGCCDFLIVPLFAYCILKEIPTVKTFFISLVALIGLSLLIYDGDSEGVQQPHVRASSKSEKMNLLEVKYFRPTDNKVDGAAERVRGSFVITEGYLLAFLSLIPYALFLVLKKKFFNNKDHQPDAKAMSIVEVYTATLLLTILLFKSEPLVLNSAPFFLLTVSYVAIFSAICFILQSIALQYTTPNSACILFTLEPVSAAILGSLILGEPMTVQKICGGLTVVTALLLSEIDFTHLRKGSVTVPK
jgi:drug/metabolite transporter (DMT)-like permease